MANLHMDLHSNSLFLNNLICEHFFSGTTVIVSAARFFTQRYLEIATIPFHILFNMNKLLTEKSCMPEHLYHKMLKILLDF